MVSYKTCFRRSSVHLRDFLADLFAFVGDPTGNVFPPRSRITQPAIRISEVEWILLHGFICIHSQQRTKDER